MTQRDTHDEYAALVGIDWADRKHDICLQAVGQDRVEHRVIRHTPEALDQWASALRTRFPDKPIAMCVELAKGPLVSALLKYDFIVIYPVNPESLARYRQAWTPSRAKDDPTDALLALEVLRIHRDKLTPLVPQSAPMRALQQLVEDRRRLVGDRVRLTNRLTAALKRYYPQVLDWFGDKGTVLFCDFIDRWPTVDAATRARPDTLTAFLRQHNVRHRARINDRVAAIKCSISLTDDIGVLVPARLLALALVRQLREVLVSIQQYDEAITHASAQLDDYHIFESFPGAAATLAPRLLAAFGEDRERYHSAAEVQQHAGISTVTERSGNSQWVHWRYRCPTFLRQTFIEWAGQTVPRSYWAEAFYQQQRAKGASHQVAIRALAYKWLRIMCRCWKNRTPYDEATYLKALKRRHSPLLAAAATAPQA